MTSAPQPIEIQLYARDTGALPAQASEVAAAVGKIPGVIEILFAMPAAVGLTLRRAHRAAPKNQSPPST